MNKKVSKWIRGWNVQRQHTFFDVCDKKWEISLTPPLRPAKRQYVLYTQLPCQNDREIVHIVMHVIIPAPKDDWTRRLETYQQLRGSPHSRLAIGSRVMMLVIPACAHSNCPTLDIHHRRRGEEGEGGKEGGGCWQDCQGVELDSVLPLISVPGFSNLGLYSALCPVYRHPITISYKTKWMVSTLGAVPLQPPVLLKWGRLKSIMVGFVCVETQPQIKMGCSRLSQSEQEKQFGICPMRSFPLDLKGIIFNSSVGES